MSLLLLWNLALLWLFNLETRFWALQRIVTIKNMNERLVPFSTQTFHRGSLQLNQDCFHSNITSPYLRVYACVISIIDSLASTFSVCPLPVITCPVTANHSPVSHYIVRWLELGKHEMEVPLILIQVFNGVFYLRVSLLSHFRWAVSLKADLLSVAVVLMLCYSRGSRLVMSY